MPIFDLLLKFRGLEAFCGHEISNYQLGNTLYGDTTSKEEIARQITRLTAGEKALGLSQCERLCGEFNALIANAMGANHPGAARGPLRPDDWHRPAPEFFSTLADCYGDMANERLDRTHNALLNAMNALSEHREMSTDLMIDRAPAAGRNVTRIPEVALPTDPLDLPPKRLAPAEQMTAELARPVAAESRGWMFYIRNPDPRTSTAISRWIWEDDAAKLVFWQPSPFYLPQGFQGTLPGFPSAVRNLPGEVTAYLLIEAIASPAVQQMLEDVGTPWRTDAPNFEATVHLIAQGRKLFQKGNRREGIAYPPPRLLTRRYIVR